MIAPEYLVDKDEVSTLEKQPPQQPRIEDDSTGLKGICIRDESSLLKDAIVKSNTTIHPNLATNPGSLASATADQDQSKETFYIHYVLGWI